MSANDNFRKAWMELQDKKYAVDEIVVKLSAIGKSEVTQEDIDRVLKESESNIE